MYIVYINVQIVYLYCISHILKLNETNPTLTPKVYFASFFIFERYLPGENRLAIWDKNLLPTGLF